MEPVSRAEAISTIKEASGKLFALADRLAPEVAIKPSSIGGGEWSARDLVGHVETWEEVALANHEAWSKGEVPQSSTVVTDEASMDRFNAEQIEAKSQRSWEETLSSYKQTNAKLIAAIESLSDDDWGSPIKHPSEEPRTLGQSIGGATAAPKRPFGHIYAHLDDLAKLVNETEQA